MYPDIPKSVPVKQNPANQLPERLQSDFSEMTPGPVRIETVLNGNQESPPWLCALLFVEGESGRFGNYSGSDFCGVPVKTISDTNPHSTMFSLSIPSQSYKNIRHDLSKKTSVIFPDRRNDIVFPLGRKSHTTMIEFPAMIDDEEQPVLISCIRQAGGMIQKLEVVYLTFLRPLTRHERTAFFWSIGHDPSIRFVMLEFPEG